jgi:hypothetical protein
MRDLSGTNSRELSKVPGTAGGPPGSRSQRLRTKRNCQTVVVCRSRSVCRLFSRNRVVWCRPCLVVLRKYEAYSDLAVRNLLDGFQDRIATVRVRARVGPPTLDLRRMGLVPQVRSVFRSTNTKLSCEVSALVLSVVFTMRSHPFVCAQLPKILRHI